MPAAACDYTTGYVAAFGAMVALERRAEEGGSRHVRTSLTQTAMWVQRQGDRCDPASASGVGDPTDLLIETQTPFGVVRHLRPAVELPESPPRWQRPTVPHGFHEPAWED